MSLEIVILAAGQGKRMHSKLPKVLHPIAGKPMLVRVIETARLLKPHQIHIIVGEHRAAIEAAIQDFPVHLITQTQPLGTGHAVQQALPFLTPGHAVLILSGDVPFIQANTLQPLVDQVTQQGTDLALLVADLPDPFGLGRIVRENGRIVRIVEEKDALPEEKRITETYSGICCATQAGLNTWLPALSNDNAQHEYYLTDILSLASKAQATIHAIPVLEHFTIQGVNTPLQRQILERQWYEHQALQLLNQGVSIADLKRIDIRGTLSCQTDVFIDINTLFEGEVSLEAEVFVGPNCVLRNVVVGKHTRIQANSVLENCIIGEHCDIGPFARIRPGSVFGDHCKIGNFVETKNAVFDTHSKANHLAYLGDVSVGKHVNIGAGTITCNYDGYQKHHTTIKDHAFIGSDTQLIAPICVGEGATIGAGTSLRKDAPDGMLTLSTSTQTTIKHWKRPSKKQIAEEKS